MHCRNDVAAEQPGSKTIIRTVLPTWFPVLWVLTAAMLFGSPVSGPTQPAGDATPGPDQISRSRKRRRFRSVSRGRTRTSSAVPNRRTPTRLERAFPHHKFHNSVYLNPEPGTDRLFVMEYSPAIVRAIKDDPNSKEEVELLEYPAGKGKKSEALSIIFHPNYRKNRLRLHLRKRQKRRWSARRT